MLDSEFLTIASILFVATLARSTFGFGFGLMAMPLITLTGGLSVAVPLVALVSLTIGGLITWSSHQEIDLRAAQRLLGAAILGIPIGLFFLKNLPADLVKTILGILVISLGSYNLVRPKLFSLEKSGWAYLFGFVAGMLGGAYNIPAAPVVIYGTLRHWPPQKFRATLQGFMFPAAILVSIGHGLAGLWSISIFQLYLSTLPLVLLAILLGSKLNRYINPGYFQKLLHVGLIVVGVMLLK